MSHLLVAYWSYRICILYCFFVIIINQSMNRKVVTFKTLCRYVCWLVSCLLVSWLFLFLFVVVVVGFVVVVVGFVSCIMYFICTMFEYIE